MNILVVEDNADDEALTLRALKKIDVDHDIVVTRDGQEALDYLFATGQYEGRDIEKNPELVLLDLNLPKVSGLEVLQRLRSDERTKLMPVVILTTSKEKMDVARSYELGANSYIRKAIDFLKFSETIKQLGLYWLVLNESPPQK
ncbi:MAG: response regulator [bacterium]|nr:response regulator [bacterium]